MYNNGSEFFLELGLRRMLNGVGREPESKVDRTTEGYSRLAVLMAQQPDLAIFLSFIELSAELLLHRQAEIVQLRKDLWEQQKDDNATDESSERYEYKWDSATLRASIDPDQDPADGHDPRQWEILLKLRTQVKEYHEALIQHRQILEFQKPHAHQRESLVKWMSDKHRGRVPLTGVDSDVWETTDLADLINMEPASSDALTRRLSVNWVRFYNKCIGKRLHKPETAEHLAHTILYQHSTISAWAKFTMTVIACMLPIAAIGVLYAINSMQARLGVIAAFTFVFSVVLDQFTAASVKDIFSATAAFSAVLVVFVGTTN